MFLRYWNQNADATARKVTEGWLRTGDPGEPATQSGQIHLPMPVTTMSINYRTVTVSARVKIEQALASHPDRDHGRCRRRGLTLCRTEIVVAHVVLRRRRPDWSGMDPALQDARAQTKVSAHCRAAPGWVRPEHLPMTSRPARSCAAPFGPRVEADPLPRVCPALLTKG